MAAIALQGVGKTYPGKETRHILRNVDFTIADGEFVVLVGPSGCGKSTLLRMIAGLEEISEGAIHIGGERVNETPPAKRGLSMVFQSYALYAHMTVFENIAFSLRLARVPKAEIRSAVQEVARMLQMEHLLERRPPQLSGGQRQRVAIGRAIVRKPRAFLFDEPLSNLDAALRADMRVEIARLHKQLGATMVYVTHDQVEAMTLADRIVVLGPAGVQQIGAPMHLYDRPANVFVAGFIGSPKMNLVPGRLDTDGQLVIGNARIGTHAAIGGGNVTVGIRPEHLVPDAQGPIRGQVLLVERLGADSYVHLSVAGLDKPLMAVVQGEPPVAGVPWAIAPQAGRVHVFDEHGLRLEAPGGSAAIQSTAGTPGISEVA
ncbi:multiple sugar transport system ATP-binding protein [Pseudoduganella flava]|uniref:Multiple sugar transport system ATP-binding protein n=1 Tax=Pseudoduganella flava TaxID=871742 RepID=A0A562Q172_9BURK|nr:sn-glycerol-3-phosphate ABC transporter ATP-binding protein UgpC [Pseudoduganella flava]QGZ38273.1 sn-glycerol-3-phosphate ABC transporter ATP-binding protein UgpC [Pseudoduganella flava]TWI50190.1 multiple sugar transport system ATP-binding protein [Pseudoduganella flava]